MEVNKENKATTNCEVDTETKESLLNHLDVHGAVSLLTSAKFGQYAGCFPEEITRAIAAETATPIAPTAADDSTGKQEALPTPAGETTESPAAMPVRVQGRRITTSYRQGRR